VLAFQHLTTLRLTYIEGNHRHVKFFSLPVHNPWVMEISANDGHVNH